MRLSHVKDQLQLLSAGLFVFIGLGLMVFMFSWLFPHWLPPWVGVPVVLLTFFALIMAAMTIFGGKSARQISAERLAANIRDLEENGLLILQPFRARRAFAVEEFEDEGLHFYLEVEDKSTLFLSGQYLYDYERAPARRHRPARARQFPCTEFTARRHKLNGYAIDIQCSGSVLEPEVVAPWFDEDDFRNCHIPEDGAILREKTYDQIKMERQKRRKSD